MFAKIIKKKGGNDDKTRIYTRGGGGKSFLGKGFGLFDALKTACNYLHRNSKVLLILSFCLITTAVLAAGRCVPCKLNHYCVDGLRYQCPSTAPVTQGTGAGALNECLTCVQRNGNSANPIYDDLVGDCVSCYEYDSSTPIWDGNSCVACASGTVFNGETGLCESNCPGNINDAGVCILTAKLNECESGYIGIMTAEQLAKIGKDTNYPANGAYCLLNDISLAAYGENYNNGEGWTPIGEFEESSWGAQENRYAFYGVFDGNNHEISDLYINKPDGPYNIGLFSFLEESSVVRNLGVSGEITGLLLLGGLAGGASGDIINCYANVKIYGEAAGGLVGQNNGTISNSYTKGTVTTTSDKFDNFHSGGLVGVSYGGSISRSYSSCDVSDTSGNYSAGLVGRLQENSTITDCYATGANASGGLVGVLESGTISNCYSLARAEFALVSMEYDFTASEYSVSSSFFDADILGTDACGYINHPSDYENAAKSTAEMQTPQTFIDAGWDTSIWELVQGQYPKLKGVGGQN